MPDVAAVELASPEWAAAFAAEAAGAADLPAVPGASATVAVVVTGGPGGRRAERPWRFVLRDGRVESAEAGPTAEGEADLVLTQPWDDAVALLRATDALDEAFMRGTTKIAGSSGVLMRLLPVLRSEGWSRLWAAMAVRTQQ